MSFFVRHTASSTRSYPRTMVVLGFVLLSGVAQLQTVVNLHP